MLAQALSKTSGKGAVEPSGSVGLVPVFAHACVHGQRDAEPGRAGHQFGHGRAQCVRVPFRDLEYQFVVHLHDHARPRETSRQHPINVDHGAFDDIGGRALHRGVDGGALGILAPRVIPGIYVRQIQPAPENGLHKTPIMGLTPGSVRVNLHRGMALLKEKLGVSDE